MARCVHSQEAKRQMLVSIPPTLLVRFPAGGCYLLNDSSSLLSQTSLKAPSGTCPEVCLLGDSKSSQVDSENHRKGN